MITAYVKCLVCARRGISEALGDDTLDQRERNDPTKIVLCRSRE